MATYKQQSGSAQGRGYFSKVLRKISNFGLIYDEVENLNQSQAIGANEDVESYSNMGNVTQGPYMYDLFTKKIISKILDKKAIAYLDRSYFDKRKILRQYSIKDEIRDFINQISDEVVIYDDENNFCYCTDLPDEFDDVIRSKVHENFNKLYNVMGFSDGTKAWYMLRDLLIDGFISYEIVYDKKQRNIVDIVKLDPLTLVPASDPETGTIVWVQYPDDPKLRRMLLDAQIIYISYSNNRDYGETSYVEPLIRPYNQLKLLEQTKIIYNINQSAVYKKFVIPVGGLSRQQAEQQIYQLMSEYHEEITWDDNLGIMTINGSSEMPHSKDFWFPSGGEGGEPDISIESPQGNDLNEDTILQWFKTNLHNASRMPHTRFDKENGGGSLFNDASELTRDELKFHNYIRRIRTVFREIMIKPLKIQMLRDFPELLEDHNFIKKINIKFYSNELFEEWKYLNNLDKRANIAANLSSNLQNIEGESFLPLEWIARKIMKLTDEDLAEIEKYKLKERSGLSGEGGEGGEDRPPTGPGGPFFGGGDEFGGGAQGGDDLGGAQGGGAQGGGAQGGDEFGGESPDIGGDVQPQPPEE